MSTFTELQKERRSIYALGKDVALSNQELVELIEEAVLQAPSAFNSQTSRIVVLFGEESDAFWNEIAASELEKVTPAEAFEGTKQKLASFAAGKGTILFFEDQDVVKGLQENFPLYAENFPIWSEQAHGIALYSVWMALASKNVGMNVQHYNPLVDAQVAEKYDIPANWKLRAQAPFGSIQAPASDKEVQTENRFKVFGE
ncbi:nitroreductase family protein [Streptococcus sp. DD13]|uniref:nitroreductase family protein n=1 Tax=Streptococcus sp. DD13 TaxID=1777881 RepID=UPI0007976CD5|nr:nitroreductase family protein [Streptococcus sp. DD13]KXT77920.1 Nitroreductase family protein [Streptococcus sp. DD13]